MKQRFTTTSPGTQAVVRAIALLKAVARPGLGHRVTDLSLQLDLNKATVFRLLGALEAEGMVVRDHADGYRLGPELITLGASALGSADLSLASHDELLALAELTGETATLEVMIGAEALVISAVRGRFLLGSAPELGMRSPSYLTSTGKVMLALSQQPIALGRMERRTEESVASRADLDVELETIRRQGYAIATEQLEIGFTALAAPVRNHFGIVVAALSINGPSARLRPAVLQSFVGAVCDAADSVSRSLGATEEMLRPTAAEGRNNIGVGSAGKSQLTATSR